MRNVTRLGFMAVIAGVVGRVFGQQIPTTTPPLVMADDNPDYFKVNGRCPVCGTMAAAIRRESPTHSTCPPPLDKAPGFVCGGSLPYDTTRGTETHLVRCLTCSNAFWMDAE